MTTANGCLHLPTPMVDFTFMSKVRCGGAQFVNNFYQDNSENWRTFSCFSAPPELITFYHQPGFNPEPGSDFTSGSVQFQLTSPDMGKSYNATCFAKSARPEAQVTWFIGNEQVRQYFLSRTFSKMISIKYLENS